VDTADIDVLFIGLARRLMQVLQGPSDTAGARLEEPSSDTGAASTTMVSESSTAVGSSGGGSSSSTQQASDSSRNSSGGSSSSSGRPSFRQAGCIHDTAIDGVIQPVLQWVSALIDIWPNSILAGGKAAPVLAEAALTAAENLDHLLHLGQHNGPASTESAASSDSSVDPAMSSAVAVAVDAVSKVLVGVHAQVLAHQDRLAEHERYRNRFKLTGTMTPTALEEHNKRLSKQPPPPPAVLPEAVQMLLSCPDHVLLLCNAVLSVSAYQLQLHHRVQQQDALLSHSSHSQQQQPSASHCSTTSSSSTSSTSTNTSSDSMLQQDSSSSSNSFMQDAEGLLLCRAAKLAAALEQPNTADLHVVTNLVMAMHAQQEGLPTQLLQSAAQLLVTGCFGSQSGAMSTNSSSSSSSKTGDGASSSSSAGNAAANSSKGTGSSTASKRQQAICSSSSSSGVPAVTLAQCLAAAAASGQVMFVALQPEAGHCSSPQPSQSVQLAMECRQAVMALTSKAPTFLLCSAALAVQLSGPTSVAAVKAMLQAVAALRRSAPVVRFKLGLKDSSSQPAAKPQATSQQKQQQGVHAEGCPTAQQQQLPAGHLAQMAMQQGFSNMAVAVQLLPHLVVRRATVSCTAQLIWTRLSWSNLTAKLGGSTCTERRAQKRQQHTQHTRTHWYCTAQQSA